MKGTRSTRYRLYMRLLSSTMPSRVSMLAGPLWCLDFLDLDMIDFFFFFGDSSLTVCMEALRSFTLLVAVGEAERHLSSRDFLSRLLLLCSWSWALCSYSSSSWWFLCGIRTGPAAVCQDGCPSLCCALESEDPSRSNLFLGMSGRIG